MSREGYFGTCKITIGKLNVSDTVSDTVSVSATTSEKPLTRLTVLTTFNQIGSSFLPARCLSSTSRRNMARAITVSRFTVNSFTQALRKLYASFTQVLRRGNLARAKVGQVY